MTYNNIKYNSLYISVLVHVIIFVIMYFYVFNVSYTPNPPVELSFGTFDQSGSAGAQGKEIMDVPQQSKPAPANKTEKKSEQVVKKVDLPQAQNTSDDNVVTPADKNKKVAKQEETKTDEEQNSNVSTEGQGNKTEGKGSLGYDIDWGGKGKRQIYSYSIPAYPAGVNKEVDIRLKFTILPDGTVGSILPLTKADARLESTAITYLRQWRFEPLSPDQPQKEQTAVIVFPYRLQ
jgi:outer membrane biosynthesis protein TonB